MTAEEVRRRQFTRNNLIQAAILGLVILIVWGTITSARTNLASLGMTSGFDFLSRATGWSYSFSLLERSIEDPYGRTIIIGITNTLFLGLICIVLSTILGFIAGTARDARNIGINTVATIYVQIFRNVPLILQVVFWYSFLIESRPAPRQVEGWFDLIFLTNRGMFIPVFNASPGTSLATLVGAAFLAVVLARSKALSTLRMIVFWAVGTTAFGLFLTVVNLPEGAPVLSVPELQGLRFQGGLSLSIELIAMIVSIVLYSGAYIAEVVRGGLKEVPIGLVEAGLALGLSTREIWFKIKMPMALRTLIPPLGNQWIFTMKATTVGVAIGFSDLFMIVSTSITQSGQTLELIAILMGAFLLINYSIAQLVNLLNARVQLKGH